MDTANKQLHQIAFSFIEGMGCVHGRALLENLGGAEQVLNADRKTLHFAGASNRLIDAIQDHRALRMAEKELSYILKENIEIIFWTDSNYPKRLKNCPDSPLLLYYKGTDVLHSERIISIVGTRNATSYGRAVCKEFIEELKPYKPLIISGMAYGIDSFAHQGAYNNGLPTVGVLGHGLDRIYPETHTSLAKRMLENGGLLTEFPMYTRPERYNFPMRNRIIAGMADVTIVVEAAKKGGALITAEIANGYNRDVCAFPGNIYQEFSAGCNHLIKSNRAFPISSASDLEYLMSWEPLSPIFKKPSAAPPVLSAEEERIHTFLHSNGPASFDKIIQNTGMEMSQLSLVLLQMELKEVVMALPGSVYRSMRT